MTRAKRGKAINAAEKASNLATTPNRVIPMASTTTSEDIGASPSRLRAKRDFNALTAWDEARTKSDDQIGSPS